VKWIAYQLADCHNFFFRLITPVTAWIKAGTVHMSFNRALKFVITRLEDNEEKTYSYFFVFFCFVREAHRSTELDFVTAQVGAGYFELFIDSCSC
jgi:hypothetical protein